MRSFLVVVAVLALLGPATAGEDPAVDARDRFAKAWLLLDVERKPAEAADQFRALSSDAAAPREIRARATIGFAQAERLLGNAVSAERLLRLAIEQYTDLPTIAAEARDALGRVMGGRARWFAGTATLGAGQWLDLDSGGVFLSRATYSGTLAEIGRSAAGIEWPASAVNDPEFATKLASYGSTPWRRVATDEGHLAWVQVLADRPSPIVRFVTRAEGEGAALSSPDPVFAVGRAAGQIDVHFRVDPAYARYRIDRRTGPEGVYIAAGEAVVSPYTDVAARLGERYGYRITGVASNGDEGIPATVQATTNSNGVVEGIVELDRLEGTNGVDLLTGEVVPSARADLVLTGTYGGRSGASFADGWGRSVVAMDGADDVIRSPWTGAAQSGFGHVDSGRWFALPIRGGGVARGRVTFPPEGKGGGHEVRVEYTVSPDAEVFPEPARLTAQKTDAGIEVSIECLAGTLAREIVARVVDSTDDERRLPVEGGRTIDANAPEGRLVEYRAVVVDVLGRVVSRGRIVWNGLPFGVRTGTFQFHYQQGWSFERSSLAPVDEADVYFKSAAGGISSITLEAAGGIASLDRTIREDGLVARGRDRMRAEGWARAAALRIVAIDPAVLQLERSANCDSRDPVSDVVVVRTRHGGWAKLALVYRGKSGGWTKSPVAVEYWFNAREPRFVDPGPDETAQNGIVLRPPVTTESVSTPLRGGPFSEPHVLLSVRSGAGGGNPNRIDMLGGKSIYVREVTHVPLVWDPFVEINETSRAYVHGNPVPAGKVFVITSVTWRGVAAGDSNGRGEVVIRAGDKELAKWRDDGRPRKGAFAGRILIRPGDESKVNVEVANSSHVEALFEGVLVDESAAESVPAGVRTRPLSAEETVNEYRDYTDEQLQDPAHEVTIDMLLDIVSGDQAPREVRERAAETITLDRVIMNEAGLSLEGRHENRKRAEFSMKVNKFLGDNDPFQRQLARQILERLWVGWKSINPVIKNCDPRDKDSCVKAQKEWDRIFRG